MHFSIKTIALIFATSFSAVTASDAETSEDKPNVLIFFIDDLGVMDLGVNGSTFYETPHIDALAKGGVNFANAYAANPVCSPTRAALMTGKVPQRVGITAHITKASEYLALSEVTIAEAFKEAGYRTGYIGKWHLGKNDDIQPKHQGFDWTVGVNRKGQPGSFFYPFGSDKKGAKVPDLESYKKGDYLTDALTDKSIEFISEKSDKPFFLCLSHYAVHTPIQAPEELIKKYELKRKETFGDAKNSRTTEKYNTPVAAKQEDPTYAAMMENLDTNIGRVLTALEENSLLENTIIVFTSDNGGLIHRLDAGGPTSNKPYRAGKAWTYEGGIRIPTIVSWQGKITPTSSDARMITMDIYPTLLDLAGIPLKPKQHLDGKSLKNILHGKPDSAIQERFLAWTYPHTHRSGHKPSHAIILGDWKLIMFDSEEPSELYKLSEDMGELNNLAEKQPEKVKELTKTLNLWIKSTVMTKK